MDWGHKLAVFFKSEANIGRFLTQPLAGQMAGSGALSIASAIERAIAGTSHLMPDRKR